MIQSILLGTYKRVYSSGLLSTPLGTAAFECAYDIYKSCIEVGDVRCLRQLVQPGTWMIDVGANVGFFTEKFAGWVEQGGRVLAIEPEKRNFERLNQRLKRRHLADMVDCVLGAAAEKEGTLHLAINPYHPADHRIADEGLPVKAFTLDGLMAEKNWPVISLIKIDVQGAEMRVLKGAREVLERFNPALFMEIDDDALKLMNSGAEELLATTSAMGYSIRRLVSGMPSPCLTIPATLPLCCDGRYDDFLFTK